MGKAQAFLHLEEKPMRAMDNKAKVTMGTAFLAFLLLLFAGLLFYGLFAQPGGTSPPVVSPDDYYAEGTITINIKDNRGLSALSNIDVIEFYPHGTSFKDCASGAANPEHTASAVSTSTTWYIDSTNGGPLPAGNQKLKKTVWVEEGSEPVYTYYPGPYEIEVPSIPKTASTRTATSSDILCDDVGSLSVSATAFVPGQSGSTSAIVLDASAGNEYVDLAITVQQAEADSVLRNLRMYVIENSSAWDSSDICDPGAYTNLKSMKLQSKSGGVSELLQEEHGTDGGLSTSYDVFYVDLPDMEYDNGIPDTVQVTFRLTMDAGTTDDPAYNLGVIIVAAGWDAQNYGWTEYNDDNRDYYKTNVKFTID